LILRSIMWTGRTLSMWMKGIEAKALGTRGWHWLFFRCVE
jgi:hypothetical protein